jgi:hypothetical protein
MAKINVLSREVAVLSVQEEGYICLTDIARSKNEAATDDLIRNWLRNRNTLEFLGIWEHLYNPGFNPVEFDGIKSQAVAQEAVWQSIFTTILPFMRQVRDSVIASHKGELFA